MDVATVDCAGCYLCLATVASPCVLYQAEAHVRIGENFWDQKQYVEYSGKTS